MNKHFNITNLKDVPNKPGCYLWKDIHNNILYVGKAKDLKKRTSQYFLRPHSNKIYQMTNLIRGIDYIITNDENEALILENNLIKEHKPKYNTLLKEGTNSYPYIVLTEGLHPKIIYTRKYNSVKGKYYGPFASNDTRAYDLYIYLNKIFPFRKCNVIPKQKCLYYDLGQCLAPCINKIEKQQYEILKKQIDDVFSNNNKNLIANLKSKELVASKALNFEQANYFFKLQENFKSVVSNQIMQLQEATNIDIIGYFCNEETICINIFNYVNGKLVAKHEMIDKYFNDVHEIVTSYLMQFYTNNKIPKDIIVSLDEDNIKTLNVSLNTHVFKPIKGQNLQLLTMAITNAKYYLQKNQLKSTIKYDRTIGACETLANLLHMDNVGYIEMIDNSNIFLKNPVSAIVVFKNGIAEKSMYRKYHLDNTTIKSDFHFMKEVIKRRFTRLLKENRLLPNVFIVDGGKVQVQAAKEIFTELNLSSVVKIIGLRKDEHHKTDAIVTDDDETILLDKKSNLFFLLSSIQEEVHKFAISFFRSKDIKSKLSSFLDNIDGIGLKTKNKILSIYPNLADIKKVNIETLSQIMSKKTAILLKQKIEEIFHD